MTGWATERPYRGGKRGARSYTAALATDDVAVDALLAHTGVIRANSLDQLLDVAALLAGQPAPSGRRVALIGNAGGPLILAADAASANDLDVVELSAAPGSRRRPTSASPTGDAVHERFRHRTPVVRYDRRPARHRLADAVAERRASPKTKPPAILIQQQWDSCGDALALDDPPGDGGECEAGGEAGDDVAGVVHPHERSADGHHEGQRVPERANEHGAAGGQQAGGEGR